LQAPGAEYESDRHRAFEAASPPHINPLHTGKQIISLLGEESAKDAFPQFPKREIERRLSFFSFFQFNSKLGLSFECESEMPIPWMGDSALPFPPVHCATGR
jgi:hypothetical protein